MVNLLKSFQGVNIVVNYGTPFFPGIFVAGEVLGVYTDYVAIKRTVGILAGTTINISIKDINFFF